MKHPDEAVDKVFAALRSTEPLPGMKDRILEGAYARAAQSPLSPWSRLRQLMEAPSRSIAAWSFVLGAIVIAAAVPTIHHTAHTPPQTKTQPKLIAPMSTVAGSQQAPSARPGLPSAKVRRARVFHNEDSAARQQSQVSFPTPPMPLTDQEQLLLRIVHQGDPVEMAMLDPNVRARQNAEGKAEFQRFFDAPTQGDPQ